MSVAVKTSSTLAQDRMDKEEWQVRVDLAACYRLVAHYGWDDMIFTHISARVPGPDHHFLINPYGMFFEEITASSLVKIGMDGEKVEDSPWPVNPAGFTIHSAVHEGRDDAKCVMHLHTLDGTAVSASEGGLQPLNQTAMLVRGDLAYHEYEGIALDHDERPRLQKDLGDKNLMLLWNHGTLAVGETVAQTFLRMYFLERACSTQVRTLSAAESIHPPAEPVVEKTAHQGKDLEGLGRVAEELAWPALLRMLDRRDPSYKD